MRTTIGNWSDENYNGLKVDTSLNKQKPMYVQTGGGSDVVVKNNPNILTYVWEEKYSPDTLTSREIIARIFNQNDKEWQ